MKIGVGEDNNDTHELMSSRNTGASVVGTLGDKAKKKNPARLDVLP